MSAPDDVDLAVQLLLQVYQKSRLLGRKNGGGRGSNSSKIFRGETDGKEKNFILIFSSPTQKQTVILRHFSYYSTSFSCLFSLISSSNKLLQSQKSFLTYFVFSSSCRLSQQYTAKQHFFETLFSYKQYKNTSLVFQMFFFSFTTRWVIFRDWGNEGGYFVVIVYHFLLKKCKKSSFSASFLLISTGQLVILGGQLIFSFTLVFAVKGYNTVFFFNTS